jgi:radical SAM protein with 4Fe4S-binding SPASM domain
LEHIFDLTEKENFSKIYVSHLVYSGRGLENLAMDLSKEERIKSVEYILNKTFEYQEQGRDIEVVTGNMECDAVMFLKMVKKRYPHLISKLVSRLSAWGGNSSGRKLLNIDSFGYVKPDPFFPFRIGNIKEENFSKIWNNGKSLLLDRLRNERKISGKCSRCKYMFICNGGSRSRSYAVSGDLWGEDPSCYLTDKEIA